MVMRPKIEPTKDGLFVVRLRQVPVNWDQKFDEAIRAAAPNTRNNYLIWQAAEQYPTPAGKSGIELTDISLLGYGSAWDSQKGVYYAAKKNLPTAHPLQVFAIGEVGAHPYLHADLGYDIFTVVCLQECELDGLVYLPSLWINDREAYARRFDFGWGESAWFAVLGEVS